eukprot:5930672-Amphidinium_carterae.1
MKPTWNNVTQSPSEFIRHFQNWRDEIFNYENTVQTLTQNLATANFDDAAMKVEDYYRNVYIDNRKDDKGKGDYNQGKGEGYSTDYQPHQPQPYQKGKGKGKYNSKGRGTGYKGYNNYSNYSRPKGSYYNYRKGKGKGSKGKPSNNNIPPMPPYKERDHQKENEPTSCATTMENPGTIPTNAG